MNHRRPLSPRSSHLERLGSLVPTVVVGRHGHSALYDTVVDDELAGAALVVHHFVGLGHRRMAHVEQALHREGTSSCPRRGLAFADVRARRSRSSMISAVVWVRAGHSCRGLADRSPAVARMHNLALAT
ncbi:type 1 periplasmic-binding domain-containing protein [Streptomyces flaveolus]|uniref:hypothetical protein n=1 Tax=Streptomyces flaveolus TaxID=67297 RepID=UPI0036FBB204